MGKPMGKILNLLKPKTKIVVQHTDGARYSVVVNNNLSGKGVWAVKYQYWNPNTRRYDEAMTGGYFQSSDYEVLRINGRFA